MARIAEISTTFLQLGLIAFGGPVAHLGYFHRWFVEDRRWLDSETYTQTLALCQLLPGPTSSQTGFAIGLHRGGLAGGLAAWLGFTLPSAALMIGMGVGVGRLGGIDSADWLAGLKLAAVAVVAHALYGTARQLCPDRSRQLVAAASALAVSLIPGAVGPFMVIIGGAVAGLALFRPSPVPHADLGDSVSRWQAIAALAFFALGLLALAGPFGAAPLYSALYQSGALVFGGGHVVLPLLDASVVGPGLIDNNRFIAGYGAAQALPGPLFSFGGFLGASVMAETPVIAGLIATLVIFAPGLLLVIGLLPFWQSASRYPASRRALPGINAAVVGLLAAVLWDPVITDSIHAPGDVAIALIALALLSITRTPPWAVVAGCALAGAGLGYWPSMA
ncbi:chromate efflux transporter [Spiribacter vilamensis]|uniref:Chromate transporter n=1 Tax=Spiribacter vilamensis TaxID=531306 RepID=A0A4Q8CYT8_9GAMM|nr:chromate efflux transporter [Spiribacter vilamensis]RZU98158.1 chromate transporter [Spiribacter vilamensis]TVO60941.1 chromate efflux transporter [Spiribacter vilamensis]